MSHELLLKELSVDVNAFTNLGTRSTKKQNHFTDHYQFLVNKKLVFLVKFEDR